MIEAALLVVFPCLVAFAGASDLFTMTIPNRVSLIMIAVLAIQGLRFQKLLKLPDGGADIGERVIERLRTMINELE